MKKKVAREARGNVASVERDVEAEFLTFAANMVADIKRADASRVRNMTRADGSSLSPIDRVLLLLVESIEGIARERRRLVERPDTYAVFAGGLEWLEAEKRRSIVQLTKMRNVWFGAKGDDAAPYVAARMALADGVAFYATIERTAPSQDRALDRAMQLATSLASSYPSLAEKLSETDRIERIRQAIVAKTSRDTMPWKQIAAAWTGIEAGPDPSTWKVDWAKRHRKG